MVSISAGDFSGNAAVRLARPIRCSRIIGPTQRAIRPNRFAVLIGSKYRVVRSIPMVNAPTAASPIGLVASRIRALVRGSKRLIGKMASLLDRFTRENQRGVLA